jgi:hypothetical protein
MDVVFKTTSIVSFIILRRGRTCSQNRYLRKCAEYHQKERHIIDLFFVKGHATK